LLLIVVVAHRILVNQDVLEQPSVLKQLLFSARIADKVAAAKGLKSFWLRRRTSLSCNLY